MMFASVEREDQEPTCPYYFGAGTCNSGCWEEPVCITGEPINGWRPRQVNEPNPILLALRFEERPLNSRWQAGYVVDGRYPTTLEHYLLQMESGYPSAVQVGLGVDATRQHIDHAQRVIRRLVALS